MPTSTYACLVIGAVVPRLERHGIIYRTDQAALLDHDELVEDEHRLAHLQAEVDRRDPLSGISDTPGPPGGEQSNASFDRCASTRVTSPRVRISTNAPVRGL